MIYTSDSQEGHRAQGGEGQTRGLKIALVFNPYRYQVYEENLRVVQKYFGSIPPLSLAWVAAILERHGHSVKLIDARSLGLSLEEATREVEAFAPDLVGFTLTVYAYRDTLEWIRHIRARVDRPVIVGGYGFGIYPLEMMAPAEIDYGFVGHVNDSLPRFLQEWRGGGNLDAVPGLFYKRDGVPTRSPAEPAPFVFDDLPVPARHLLPNDSYSSFPTQRKNYTAMVTSIGCPYRCTFCNNAHTSFTARSPAKVLAEIEECFTRYGVREIDFFDYDLTVHRPHVEAICDGLIERGLDLSWVCRARVDTIDAALLAKMHQAGCYRIYYGIESGVQSVLDAMCKGITLEKIRDTVALTRRAGIESLGYFMVGNAGETRDTVLQTIRFALSLDLDYIQCCKLIAKPGTRLFLDLVNRTGRDYWRELILGTSPPETLPRPWTNLSPDEVDRLAKKLYVAFHARPGFILRSTLKVRSFREFKRKVLAFLEMLFLQENTSRADGDFEIYRG